MTFEEWKDGYGLVLEPNYSKETEADCLAAFNFGKRESAVLIERQAAQIELMREALSDIADDYEDRFDMNSPSTNPGMKYVVKQSRAALSATPDQALEQFAAKVREQCLVKVGMLKSLYLSQERPVQETAMLVAATDDMLTAIRAIKELP